MCRGGENFPFKNWILQPYKNSIKINVENKYCWLASLSVTDTHCNSAALRQQHVPACPALPSWHLPLLPLKPAFYCPQGWREEQKDARAVGRVAGVRQGGAGSHPGQGRALCLILRGPSSSLGSSSGVLCPSRH